MERSNSHKNVEELQSAGFLEKMGIAALTAPLYYRDRINEWRELPHFTRNLSLVALGLVGLSAVIVSRPWEQINSLIISSKYPVRTYPLPLNDERAVNIYSELSYTAYTGIENINIGNLTPGLVVEVDLTRLLKFTHPNSLGVNPIQEIVSSFIITNSSLATNDEIDRQHSWVKLTYERIPRRNPPIFYLLSVAEVEPAIKNIFSERPLRMLNQEDLDKLSIDISIRLLQSIKNAYGSHEPLPDDFKQLVALSKPIKVKSISAELIERSLSLP